MGGRVVDRESAPYFPADFFAEQIRQRLTAMEVEIIHNEMDCVGVGVLQRQVEGCLSELDGRAVRCGKREGRPAFGSTAQKTLAVPHRLYSLSRLASRPGSAAEGGRTQISLRNLRKLDCVAIIDESDPLAMLAAMR